MTVADQWAGNAQDPSHWRDLMVRVTGPFIHGLHSAFAQTWANTQGEIVVGPDCYARPNEDDDKATIEHISIVNMPDDTSQPLLPLFWLSLKAARKRIYIANAYFYPDRHLLRLLIERARDGVDVRILTPGPHIDNVFVRWASHYHFNSLLQAGVRLFEYQPTMMHAKYLVVDGRWTLVG
jgi:cardiolipin synthase